MVSLMVFAITMRYLTDEEVREEFIRSSGTQFDPELTEIFVGLMDSGKLYPYTVDGMAIENR